MTTELPPKVGRYEIRKELGRGMMGVVYEALDPDLGRTVALKTIRLAFAVSEEERQAFETRFLAEARVAARLSHPGIVVVHDVGQDPQSGTLYIALEYLSGRTLASIVGDRGALDWREALRITKRVAEALHHAHSQGVIHRDIKPANIMVLDSGEPKIMDFGIAKVESSQLTAAGQFFGTPLYMSPEQALGRPLDGRSDLFSLGALAYLMLTGGQAFGGAELPVIITRVIHEDPPQPTRVVDSLPRDLDYFIARALAKDVADRYPDGKTMAEDAEDILAARPPRHRSDWREPLKGQGTLASSPAWPLPSGQPAAAPTGRPRGVADTGSRPPGATEGPPRRAMAGRLPVATPVSARVRTARAMPPARRSLPWSTLLIATVAVASLVTGGWFLWLRGRGERAQPLAEPADVQVAAATPPPAASSLATPPDATPITPPLAVTPDAAPVAPPAAVIPAAVGAPAALVIDFEHSLKAGTLRVWVDDSLAIEDALDSQVTKKLPALTLRKGSIERTLEVGPGPHEVQVEVAWEDNVKTGHISGHFAAGKTRRLSAKLGAGVRGMVKKDLKLEWE